MGIFSAIFRRKTESKEMSQVPAYTFDEISAQSNMLQYLWHNGSEKQWLEALDGYFQMLRPEQRKIEDYINNIQAETVKQLDEYGFYDFLYNKYFVWKYTAKNRLATTRKSLEKYISNGELSALKTIQMQLFSTKKSEVENCLKIACQIRGLGTAGASGLLAILFPEDFGTVDQFVAKRLQEIGHPTYNTVLQNINPEGLKIRDGVVLVEIMKQKAAELNKKFHTSFWTPRKIDMVLWAYGR